MSAVWVGSSSDEHPGRAARPVVRQSWWKRASITHILETWDKNVGITEEL